MKIWKNFSMLFLYPVLLLGTGFLGGVSFVNYFYPGLNQSQLNVKTEEVEWQQISGNLDEEDAVEQNASQVKSEATVEEDDSANLMEADSAENQDIQDNVEESVQTTILRDNLNADTAYVLEETDMRNDTVVETTWKLPAKYIGMNREEFLEAMEAYEASPPLEELERGFVSLEVLSFSPQKVVVQMNYEYTQPGESFYLMVEDNYVVVYQEDMQTVYMDTDILLKELPEELQQEIIQVMYIPDEESLYDFLENYSS